MTVTTIAEAIKMARDGGDQEGTFRMTAEVGALRRGVFARFTSDQVARLYNVAVTTEFIGGFFVRNYIMVVRGRAKDIAAYLQAYRSLDGE